MSQQWEPGARLYGGYGGQAQSGQPYPPYLYGATANGSSAFAEPGQVQQPHQYPPVPQHYYGPPPSYSMVAPAVPIAVVAPKSAAVAGVLAFFFGPIGMLYATWVGALVMFLINCFIMIIGAVTLGVGFLLMFVTVPVCVIWSVMAANEHNRRIYLVPSPPNHVSLIASELFASPARRNDRLGCWALES